MMEGIMVLDVTALNGDLAPALCTGPLGCTNHSPVRPTVNFKVCSVQPESKTLLIAHCCYPLPIRSIPA